MTRALTVVGLMLAAVAIAADVGSRPRFSAPGFTGEIGPAGFSSDGGYRATGPVAVRVAINTDPTADWTFERSGNNMLIKQSGTTYYTLDYSTGRLSAVYGFGIGNAESAGTWQSTGAFNTVGDVSLSGISSIVNSKPALTSFGGTGASITGTGLSFVINVGTVAPGSTGTITFATTATNGYSCSCYDETAGVLTNTKVTSSTTTTCVLGNFTTATGVAANWTASDKIHCIAAAY